MRDQLLEPRGSQVKAVLGIGDVYWKVDPVA